MHDLIVVGAGIAGLSAAIRAAELGLKVVLLERGAGEKYLCNTRMSGGILHVAFRSVKTAPDALLRTIEETTQGRADPSLARALAETSGRAVDWLREQGAKFIRFARVEYQHHVLAPPRRNMPGPDWDGRGPDYLLRTLVRNFAARGGVFLQGVRARELMQRSGTCYGVEAEELDGRRKFEAKAVLIADGGFQGNLDLVRQSISTTPDKLWQRGAATAIGDGRQMAQAVGAHLADLDYFYGHLLARDSFGNPKAWPYPQIDELGVAGVMVDVHGRRFADEGAGGVALANAVAKLPDPLATWAVFDQAIWDGPGRDARIPANPNLVSAGATIVKANSIRGLALEAGICPDGLESTVEQYQAALRAGELEHLSPPRSSTKRRAWPIGRAPFYAIPVCAGITYTFGGIAIDADGRVLRSSGESIPGLYAAGATTAGIEGREAPTYVGGLMKGLVFGIRAAEHATQYVRRSH